MKLAVDVQYAEAGARVGAVVFAAWGDAAPVSEHVVTVDAAADYAPGQFYRRELPCIEAMLDAVRAEGAAVELVVIDGYVDLSPGRAGLGRHLHAARGLAVVGVAKSRFAGTHAVEVLRGRSRKPLFVTAAGVDAEVAARRIAEMHGPFREPTLLKRADQLARGR